MIKECCHLIFKTMSKKIAHEETIADLEIWLASLNIKKDLHNIDANCGYHYLIVANGIHICTPTGMWKYHFSTVDWNMVFIDEWFIEWPSQTSNTDFTTRPATLKAFKKIFEKVLLISKVFEIYYSTLEVLGFSITTKNISISKNKGILSIHSNYDILAHNNKLFNGFPARLVYTDNSIRKWKVLSHIKSTSSTINESHILWFGIQYLSTIKEFPAEHRVIDLLKENLHLSIHEQYNLISHELRGTVNSRTFNM